MARPFPPPPQNEGTNQTSHRHLLNKYLESMESQSEHPDGLSLLPCGLWDFNHGLVILHAEQHKLMLPMLVIMNRCLHRFKRLRSLLLLCLGSGGATNRGSFFARYGLESGSSRHCYRQHIWSAMDGAKKHALQSESSSQVRQR